MIAAVRRLRRFSASLGNCTSGLALTEFAMSVPVLLTLGLFGLETANFAMAHLRVSNIAMMTADNGMVTAWQSYLGNLAMIKGGGLEKYWTDSEVYRCRGGNQQLARRLASAIGQERILLRAPVRSVATTDAIASARFSKRMERLRVSGSARRPIRARRGYGAEAPAARARAARCDRRATRSGARPDRGTRSQART